MRNEKRPLTEQLRQAILECGESQADISRATGIGKDKLSRFVRGERGVSMEVLDGLGLYLNLELRRAGKPKKETR
jgi:transcriptional regulator with XRE-family HTH domain